MFDKIQNQNWQSRISLVQTIKIEVKYLNLFHAFTSIDRF